MREQGAEALLADIHEPNAPRPAWPLAEALKHQRGYCDRPKCKLHNVGEQPLHELAFGGRTHAVERRCSHFVWRLWAKSTMAARLWYEHTASFLNNTG